MSIFLTLIVLFNFISGCIGSRCLKYYYTSYTFTRYSRSYYIYCSTSCCGSTYNRYCCYASNGTGTLVGGIIGGIVFVGVLIFLWVYCAKYKVRRGRVISTVNPTVTTITSGHTTVSYNQPGQVVIPPQYNAFPSQPPPPYTMTTGGAYPPAPVPSAPQYTNPVYPPPYAQNMGAHQTTVVTHTNPSTLKT